MAVKSAHGQAPWTSWERDIAHREPAAIARWTDALRARHPSAPADTVSVLRTVASRARRVPRAIDPDHGRPANLRRARQRRRLEPAGALSSRCRRQPRRWSPVSRRTTSAPPGSCGEILTTAGTSSRAPDTRGGSSASARCWRSSMRSASITSADSTRHGKCRPVQRPP